MKIIGKLADWILEFEWVVLLLVAYPLLFVTTKTTPFMLVIPGLWILRKMRGGRALPNTPLNIPILAISLMLAVSLWATFSIDFSLPKISGLIFAFGVFFAIVRHSERNLHLTIIFVLVCGIGLGGIGILATNWSAKMPFLDRIMRQLPQVITSLPAAEQGVHPNALGGLLVLFVPLALYLTWCLIKKRERGSRLLLIFSGVSAISLTALVIITQSRSALIGLLAAIGLLLLSEGRMGRWLFAIGVIVVIGLIVWQGPELLFGQEQVLAEASEVVGEISFDARLEIWSRALYGLQDFPFTGMGLGTFRRVAPVLYPFFMIAPDHDVAHAHNFYLQSGLDLGIPGLIAIFAIWIVGFAMLRQAFSSQQVIHGLPIRDLAVGVAAGLLAHFVYGLTDAVALGARPGFLLWVMFGLATGIYVKINQPSAIRYQDVELIGIRRQEILD